jgi:predicted nucleic acid-binding protein
MLDTNILILRRHLDWSALPERASISAVVLGELSAGVHFVREGAPDAAAIRADRLALLQQAESEFDPVPYDAAAARLFGRMSAAVAALGRTSRARTADLMIAATAAAQSLPLFTTNPDDYRGLDALVTVIPVNRPDTPRTS